MEFHLPKAYVLSSGVHGSDLLPMKKGLSKTSTQIYDNVNHCLL